MGKKQPGTKDEMKIDRLNLDKTADKWVKEKGVVSKEAPCKPLDMGRASAGTGKKTA